MEYLETEVTHDVVDYNFMFPAGSKLTVVVDLDAGDTAEVFEDRYEIRTIAKPSLTDPDEVTDAEEIIVYKHSLAAAVLTKRKQRQPSEEELFNMRNYVHAIAKGTM